MWPPTPTYHPLEILHKKESSVVLYPKPVHKLQKMVFGFPENGLNRCFSCAIYVSGGKEQKKNTTTLRHAKMQHKLTVDHNALKLPEYNFRTIDWHTPRFVCTIDSSVSR